jgi:hypothetical protein
MLSVRPRPLILVTAFAALCLPRAALARGFAVEPYLLDVKPDSATVAFHLHQPLSALVVVHVGDKVLPFESKEARRSHFVRVEGLAPGRVFRYEVICGDGRVRTAPGDSSYQIKTACLPGESFTFAVYGDPRPGENQTSRHHKAIVERIREIEPAFSLVLGDMVDDGSKRDAWERFFAVEAALRRRSAIYPVMGDNDHAGGRGLWRDYFPGLGPRPYHFSWGGVHFFGMQTWGTLGSQPVGELNARSEQLRWLRTELSGEEVQRAPFRVLFLHDPIFISRGRSSDLLQRAWGPLLSQKGVDVVFASWHLYERSHHDGVTHVISGGAGAELVWLRKNPDYPSQVESRTHHFCRVDVRPGAMQIRAIAEDGTVLDSLRLFPRAAESGASPPRIQRLEGWLRREVIINRSGGDRALLIRVFLHRSGYGRLLLARDLPRWAVKHGVALRVHVYDLGHRGSYELLLAAGADFGRRDLRIPAVFVGDSALGGEAEIIESLPRELASFRADPSAYRKKARVPFTRSRDAGTLRRERFEALGWGAILAAGLSQGMNLRAFATIIFVLSCLGLMGRARRQILVTGGHLTLAVFLAHLGIGVLFFQHESTVAGRALSITTNVVLLALLAGLAVLGARDALRCLRGVPAGLAPAPRALAGRELAIGSVVFTLGVIITSVELTSAGEVYLPIVVMIADPRHRPRASLDLIAYSLAVVLPLALFFVLATCAVTSRRLARIASRNLALFKLGLTLLFVASGLVFLHNLWWLFPRGS